MFFQRFFDDGLAQASYLVGCGATGEAIIVDPNRDLDQYLAAAKAEGGRITAVTETHIHADFCSGSRELAQRAGAKLYLSSEGGPEWQYQFAAEAGATLVKDGSSFKVGNIRFDVRHTPGHTPEHLCFVITDTAAATEPMGIFTGDFVFVGDVGRPDLLEKAANVAGTAESGARMLYRSLQRFKELPDYLQVWPAHGAGSACGKSMSAVPQSTVGYERLFNWAFAATDEAEFIHQILAGQPEPPRYFGEMKRVNRVGPRILGGFPRPARLPADKLGPLLRSGALVIDTRDGASFAAGHVPGTIGIPLNRSFVTWAGWLIPYDRDFHLLADDGASRAVERAVRELAMIGLDRVGGTFGTDAIRVWTSAGGRLDSVPQMAPQELGALSKRPVVIDVRGQAEWDAGHMAGARHIPLGYLTERLAEVPKDQPLVLHCQGGGRALIAAGLLQAYGVSNVTNLAGGFGAWQAAGLPVED